MCTRRQSQTVSYAGIELKLNSKVYSEINDIERKIVIFVTNIVILIY